MSDLNSKRMIDLFVMYMTLFPNSYCSVNPQHLSFIDNIENSESYSWGFDVYEELLTRWNYAKKPDCD